MSDDEPSPMTPEPMVVDETEPLTQPDFEQYYLASSPDETVTETVVFTWPLSNWRQLEGSMSSEVFTAGKRKWRILVFPEGNDQSRSHECISLFLKLLHPGDEGAEDSDSVSSVSVSPGQDPTSENMAQGVKRARINSEIETLELPPADALPTGVSICVDDPQFVNIECENTSSTLPSEPDDGGICVRALLSVWNPEHPEAVVARDVFKRYNHSVQDWGYSQFTEIRKLLRAPQEGHAVIENDKANISVVVRVIKDETGTLWSDDLRTYNSKRATGHVGLLNQGATCYLNSLVQSLFYTKVFRQAVYNIPGSSGDSVAANLQALFLCLSTSSEPVGTSDLTRAFGWTSAESFTQHDVQELNRVLMDRLETAMKGTPLEKALSEMFVGQMKSFIKCLNVDYESSRVEDFWDIQLNVRGCKNVEESFEIYTESELLSGENQYQAGDLGLQDARKGVIFESFPPVLHLQLKRYDYDYIRDMEVKINDRYEYPMEMDLSKFIDPDSEAAKSTEPWIYELHGVLVHSGDLNAGHYYALIKPEADSPWFRFDDDHVTRAAESEVLEANYGGESQNRTGIGRGLQRISSAYMLVYLRKSRLDFVFPKGPDRVSKSILDSISKQKEAELQEFDFAKKELITAKFLTNHQFESYNGAGLAPWVEFEKSGAAPISKQFDGDIPLNDAVAAVLGSEVDASKLSLWLIDTTDSRAERLESLENCCSRPLKYQTRQYEDEGPAFWLEEKPRTSKTAKLVFVKVYDPNTTTLKCIGTKWLEVGSSAQEVATSLDVSCQAAYLELFNRAEEIDLSQAFSAAEFGNGSILILELAFETPKGPEKEAEVLATEGATSTTDEADEDPFQVDLVEEIPFTSAQDYYRKMHQSVNIILSAKSPAEPRLSPDQEPRQEDLDACKILHNVPTSTTYDELAANAGALLNVDPKYLALYVTQWNGAIRLRSNGDNLRLLLPSFADTPNSYRKLTWEVLATPLQQLEQFITVYLIYIQDSYSGARQIEVNVHRDTSGSELQSALLLGAGIDPAMAAEYKIWTDRNDRLVQPLTEEMTARVISQRGEVYLAPITTLEFEISAGVTEGILVTVFHYHQAVYQTHSIPFTFGIEKSETWLVTRERLRRQLGISEKIFGNVPISYFVSVEDEEGTLITEDDFNLAEKLPPGSALGLNHAEKRRYRYNTSAITMK